LLIPAAMQAAENVREAKVARLVKIVTIASIVMEEVNVVFANRSLVVKEH
jgi:hypothetical protein